MGLAGGNGVGLTDGEALGLGVGLDDGELLGGAVGLADGEVLGLNDGPLVGDDVAAPVVVVVVEVIGA